MADATIYCDQCGRAIQPGELARGEAAITPTTAVCSACAGSLTPERRAAKKKRATPSPARPLIRPCGTTGPVDFPDFEPEPEKPKIGKFVVLGVVALALVGLVGFLLFRGEEDKRKDGSETAPAGEVEPAADEAAREAHLERIRSLVDTSYSKYKEIQRELDAFLASHPEDVEAKALRSEVDEGYGKLADEALARAGELVRRLAASGFKEQAAAKIRSIAERYGESAWYRGRGGEAVEKLLSEIGAGVGATAAGEAQGAVEKARRPRRTTASRTNAVTNSALEILDRRGMPVDWSLPPGVALLKEGRNHFVHMEQAASATACTFFTGRFKLNRGWKEIHVSCRMRARNLRTGGRVTDKAMCLIAFQDKKGRQLKAVPSSSPRLAKSSDWVQLDGKAAVPKRAEYVVLRPGLYRSLGSLDVDDVTVGPERASRLSLRVSPPGARPKTAWDMPTVGPGAPAAKPSGEADIGRAREALGRGDFAGARRALEAREGWREPDRGRAEELLEAIGEAEAAATERARLREDPYTKLLLGLREAVREGIPEAEACFRRGRAGLAAEYSEKLKYLSKRIGEADLVAAIVVEGLAALKRPVRLEVTGGKMISGRVQAVEDGIIKIKPLVGDAKDVRLVDVPPAQLVGATKLLRRGAVTKFQLASFAFVLGDMDAAVGWVAEAEGEGVKELYDDIELMKAVLSPSVPAARAVRAAPAVASGERAPPPAELRERTHAFFSQLPKGGVEGLHLTRGVVANLARRYDRSKVTAKKLAAVGGAVAGSSAFDSSLKKRLRRDQGYVFTSRSGVAGRGKTVGAVLKSLGRFLDREKPEFVRVCFDATDLARGRTAKELKPQLTRATSEILDRGAMPVLFTLVMAPPDDKDGYEKLVSYNNMVTDLAEGLKVPCVNAWIILNRNPALKQEFFRGAAFPTRSGYDAVNSVVFYLYRALESLVAGRDVPIPRVASGRGEGRRVSGRHQGAGAPPGEEEEPPPAGNLIRNGGFEELAEGFPRGWKKHNWGAGGRAPVRADRMDSHEGKRSLRIRSAGGGSKAGAFTQVTMPKGAYEIRFWATADVDERVNVHVRYGETEFPAVVVTGEWKSYKKTFNVLKKETKVSFGFCVSSPSGRVWIDEVELKYVGR